jgi:hypothetical protein
VRGENHVASLCWQQAASPVGQQQLFGNLLAATPLVWQQPQPTRNRLSLDLPKHRDLDESPQASGPSEAGWRFTKWVQCPSDENGSLTSVTRHVTGALRWIQAEWEA